MLSHTNRFQQSHDNLYVAALGCKVQRAVALAISVFDIGAVAQ